MDWFHASRRSSSQPRPQPWAVSDAPPDYIEKQLGAIVGIEIPVTRLIGKAKASQNRSAEDQAGVIHGLREDDPHDPMAEWMERLDREEKITPRPLR